MIFLPHTHNPITYSGRVRISCQQLGGGEKLGIWGLGFSFVKIEQIETFLLYYVWM